jgi:pimeloyl-ACP methyl ester carboxylesterase
LTLLAGCLSTPTGTVLPDGVNVASATAGLPFPAEGAFLVDGPDGKPLPWSVVVEKGAYGILPVQTLKVASFDGTKLSIGIFLPDVPAGVKVPVLMDVGPYFGELDDDVGTPAHVRLGKFLIENFVPHGYAVVQASVRGTGQSEGCGDYFGVQEMKDMDALVTFLGKAEWSSGSVGIIGKSYDGTTAWVAAATGNEHLKTIVPIEGIDSMKDLHYRNGSAESRSVLLGGLYSTYQFTPGGSPGAPTTGTPNGGCPATPLHAPLGAYAGATTGRSATSARACWTTTTAASSSCTVSRTGT